MTKVPVTTDLTPMFSVVSVVKNGVDGLQYLLDSVSCQTFQNIEHIVVDGGSLDGTVKVLKQRSNIQWCSEDDDGISDAMNKGVALARGEYVVFLNADDYFIDCDVLMRVFDQMEGPTMIYACDICFETNEGRRTKQSPRCFNWWTNFKNPFPTQGTVVPRSLFEKLGLFDVKLKIDMDYDFWMRAYRAGIRVKRIPEVLSVMRDGGISSRRDWAGLSVRLREERLIHRRHVNSVALHLVYAIYWPAYWLYRRLLCFRTS